VGNYIYIIFQKISTLIINRFVHKLLYEKKLQNIIVVQMYEIVKIQTHFQSNYLIFFLKCFYKFVDFGKILKNYFDSFFHLDKV
jgi:hypothetical protein